MSTEVFPSLVGQGWSITRSPQWYTTKQQNVSGKEVAVARWSVPRYQWQVTFNALREGLINGTTWNEMQQLMGFYNLRQGGRDSFLYRDSVDNTTVRTFITMTTSGRLVYPLFRIRGSAIPQRIYAVDLTKPFNLYLGSALVSPAAYTVTPWDTTNPNGPGQIVLTSGLSASRALSASFSYYWPCRFLADECAFEKFLSGYYKVQQLAFQSIK